MDPYNYLNKKLLLLATHTKLPVDLIHQIYFFLKEKLYECDECPHKQLSRKDFTNNKNYLLLKKSCPHMFETIALKMPIKYLKKCTKCNNLLCKKHKIRALYYGYKYFNKKMYLCDTCCWLEIS